MSLKGHIISGIDIGNYIIVYKRRGEYYCICDKANNIYCWTQKVLDQYPKSKIIDPKDYDDADDRYYETMAVVGEVLSGQHDNRFDHWD
jgi:hypothetical protein